MKRRTKDTIRNCKAALSRLLFPSDEKFAHWMYKKKISCDFSLDDPKTFTEKIQWRKLRGITPEMAVCSDKVAVRDFVSKRIGKNYLVGLIGVYEKIEDFRWEAMPQAFVLQCNHDCKSTTIIKDKSSLSKREKKDIIRFYRARLKSDYYRIGREKQYEGLPRRLLALDLLRGEGEAAPNDYKFFCFGGVVQLIKVDQNRFVDHRSSILSPLWEDLHWDSNAYASPEKTPKKPNSLDEMIWVAESLSRGFDFVRVDLYESEGRVYFGEMTFTPGNGFERFGSYADDLRMGNYWTLPERS